MRCDLRLRDDPRTPPAIPLGLAVPVITPGNYVIEEFFARSWRSWYRRLRDDRGLGVASNPVVEVAA